MIAHESLRKILKQNLLFQDLGPEEMDQLLANTVRQRFRKGEEIFSTEQKGRYFYLIEDGKLLLILKDGTDKIIEEGEVFGEIAIFSQSLRTGSIQALQDTTLLVFDGEALFDSTVIDPSLALKIIRKFTVRIVSYLNRKMELDNRRLEQIIQEKTQKILDAQDQLIMQEKMASLGQMTAGIAHELKNPLNFVTNFAESSAELTDELQEALAPYSDKIEKEDQELIQEVLADIKQNVVDIAGHGKRADRIINSMMEHARSSPGTRTELNLNELIRHHVELAALGFQARNRGFRPTISFELAEDMPPVIGQAQDLGRVLINLVDNALYVLEKKVRESSNPYQPVLQIRSRYAGDKAMIYIKDNGTGIPTALMSKLFEPFFTTKPTGVGNTGLGLSISHDIIVQGHKGEIRVSSEENSFTEFVISLPVTI